MSKPSPTSPSQQAAKGTGRGLSDFVQFDDETILWTASLILLNHLQKPEHRAALQGKRVLELGSGLGHLGLGLRRLGANVTCTERPKELPFLEAHIAQHQHDTTSVLQSALEHFQPPYSQQSQGACLSPEHKAKLEIIQGSDSSSQVGGVQCGQRTEAHAEQQHDVQLQGEAQQAAALAPAHVTGEPLQGSIRAVALEWGEAGFHRSPLATQHLGAFDVIICSELYYIEKLFPELLWTLKRFSGPETVIWSVFIDRPFSFMFFSLLHDEGCWEVEPVLDFDDLGLDSELQVHMHRIHLKAPQQHSHSTGSNAKLVR